MTLAAFIPARGGSKRIPGKNIRPFFGHPLLAYAIQGARDARILFDGIYVSSDSPEVGEAAMQYGATWIHRPDEYATDTSPDAEWIAHALGEVPCEQYAILRPTNPFRTGAMIQRGFETWDQRSHLKAVDIVKQHPGKMWVVEELCSTCIVQDASMFPRRMRPLWDGEGHLQQTLTLPQIYAQNASLEFRTVAPMQTYQPFLTEGYEGLDLNTEADWLLAETLVEHGLATFPRIDRRVYAKSTVPHAPDLGGRAVSTR
jgi:N-acylneuraminate cytidylyltransferase